MHVNAPGLFSLLHLPLLYLVTHFSLHRKSVVFLLKAITGHKLGAGHLRMAPEGLFKACPPTACTIARPDLPARLGTSVDLLSSFADQSMLACARCRTPPGGALACAPGSGTLPPARPPEGHWRAHPAAAPCRPHTPRRGIGVRIRQRHLAARTPHGGALACAPGSGALPAHVNGGFTFPVHRELLGTTCRESAPPSVSVSRHGRRFRSAARR